MGKLTFKDYLHNPDLLVPQRVQIIWYMIRHPVSHYQDWRKWRDRPSPGDVVLHHDELELVVGYGESKDDLYFANGTSGSWMSCCDSVRVRRTMPRGVLFIVAVLTFLVFFGGIVLWARAASG